MLLMIDNYDSFTYNLVQYFGELGEDVQTYRNDEITLDGIAKLNPERICMSPGPCNPQHAGISLDVLREFSGKLPILGVCLGHQAIGEAFGGTRRARANHHARQGERDRNRLQGRVRRPAEALQGDALPLARDRARIAAGLPGSVGVDADDGEIMGVRHKELAVEGVQFHPESILSEHGHALLEEFPESPAQGKRA